MVSFLFLFTRWQFSIVQILSAPKTFLRISFVFFRCLIGNFLSFSLSPTLWLGIFFFLLFPTIWLGIFFRGQGLTFSTWVKIYDKLGFWLKACGKVGHDICQVLASSLGVKGTSHIISMVHMQQWWLGYFMQNWSCMHLCGHSSIKFLWSCDARAQDSFSLFKSTRCFPKYVPLSIHAFIRVYFGWQKIFTAFTLQVYTHFFPKTGYDHWIFQRKAGSYLFSKACWYF